MAAPLTVTLVAPEAVQVPARAAALLAYLRELSPGAVYEVNPNAEQVAQQGRPNVIFVWGLSGSADWASSFPRESFFQLRESASDLMLLSVHVIPPPKGGGLVFVSPKRSWWRRKDRPAAPPSAEYYQLHPEPRKAAVELAGDDAAVVTLWLSQTTNRVEDNDTNRIARVHLTQWLRTRQHSRHSVSSETSGGYALQEAAVLLDIRSYSQLEVMLLSEPTRTYTVDVAFSEQFNPYQSNDSQINSHCVELLYELLYPTVASSSTMPTDDDAAPLTLLKLLVNEELSHGDNLVARVFLTHGCAVRSDHPAGPVIERRDKSTSGTHYVELGRFLHYAAMDELLHNGEELRCRDRLIGGKYWIKEAIKRPGALRARAKRMHLLRGTHDTLSRNDLSRLARAAKKTPSPRDDRQVALARTLKRMNHHHHK